MARVPLPTWCCREITQDDRYNNENLAEWPISGWVDWQPHPGHPAPPTL